MAFICLRRPVPGKSPSFTEFRTHNGVIQTRKSTGERPADFAAYTTGTLKPAAGEEEIALVDRVYGYCRRGWLMDDCRFTQHIGEGGFGAQRNHFELKCARAENLGRFYATCQGLAIIDPAFELTEDKVKNRRFATLRREGFPLLCIDLLERDAYGVCEVDSRVSVLLEYIAGLPGFDASLWSDLDEELHPIAPPVRYHDTDAGWAEWRDRVAKAFPEAASRSNTPRPAPGYQPYRGWDGSRVTPVVL